MVKLKNYLWLFLVFVLFSCGIVLLSTSTRSIYDEEYISNAAHYVIKGYVVAGQGEVSVVVNGGNISNWRGTATPTNGGFSGSLDPSGGWFGSDTVTTEYSTTAYTGYHLSSLSVEGDSSVTGASGSFDVTIGRFMGSGNVSRTINVRFAANLYYINYSNLQDGTADPEYWPTSATYDTTFRVGDPTRTGYTFAGWSCSGLNSTTAYYGSNENEMVQWGDTRLVNMSGDYTLFRNLRPENNESVTLHAQWLPNIYLISLDRAGGSGGPDEVFLQYSTSWCSDASAENKISRIEIPTLKGYAFQGYFTEEGGKGTKIIDGDGVFTEADNRHLRYFADNDTLYAHWTPIDYNISYNLDNGSYGQYHPTTATFDSFVQISNPTRTGYFFIGWIASNLDTTTAEHGADSSTSSVWDNGNTRVMSQYFNNLQSSEGATVTLIAQWSPKTYNLTYNLNSGNWGTSTAPPGSVDFDELLTIPIPVRTGYDFDGWTASNLSSTASYGSTPTTVTNRWVSGSTRVISMYFMNLQSEDGATVGLTANWQGYPYTVVFDGNGATSGEMEEQSFIYDEAQYLLNNNFERIGYTFLGWSTNPEATVPTYEDEASVLNLTTTKNDRVVLYAIWEANDYQLTFNPTGGRVNPTTITVTYDSPYGKNNHNSLPIPTRTGYIFKGWYTSQTSTTEKVASDIYTTPDNSTLYAQWQDTWTTDGNYTTTGLELDSSGYYLINSPSDLARIAYLINDTTRSDVLTMKFKLTTNLDMSEHIWNPIGTQTRAFEGEFNGAGYIVKGLTTYYNSNIASTYNYIGLFGHTNNATIENVYVQGSISGGSNVGGIIGYANGSTTLIGSAFLGNITSQGVNRGALIGGGSNSSRIIDCTVFSASSSNSIEVEGGSTTVISCVYIINGIKGYTGTDFSNYVYLSGMLAPVPSTLSWLAQGGEPATIELIQEWANS